MQRSLPVLFLVEDNGYAIRYPSKRRRPAATSRASSDRSRACTSIRWTEPISRELPRDARRQRHTSAARKGPAFVHAHVVRPSSHSLSDDEKLYKTPAEREAEARRDPIARFAEFLRANGLATDDELAAMQATSSAR